MTSHSDTVAHSLLPISASLRQDLQLTKSGWDAVALRLLPEDDFSILCHGYKSEKISKTIYPVPRHGFILFKPKVQIYLESILSITFLQMIITDLKWIII